MSKAVLHHLRERTPTAPPPSTRFLSLLLTHLTYLFAKSKKGGIPFDLFPKFGSTSKASMLSQWAKPGASPLGPSHKTNRKRPAQPPVVAVSPAKGNATAMKLVMLTQMTDWQVQDEV